MDNDTNEEFSFYDCNLNLEYIDEYSDIHDISTIPLEYIIIGIPYDGFSTQNHGLTSDGPNLIRKISNDLAIMSEDRQNVTELSMIDLGNINFDKLKLLNINKNQIPIFIGGNHAISFDCYKFIQKIHKSKDIILISFDAHLDFYNEWEGDKETHCTVMKRIHELHGSQMAIIGARDIDIFEYEEADKDKLKYLTMKEIFDSYVKENIPIQKKFIQFISDSFKKDKYKDSNNKKQDIYISFDVDVFDPSVAPATGYPIPGGFDYRTVFYLLEYLVENFNVIGADFVEYSPNLDLPGKNTGFLMAKLISEFIVMINKQK